ncbi:Putative BTB/POZ domain-containing protein [Septoria linicola]|uniref:BTB/POZ domain-containing protein n=1 Tax=Septoria linicola TaxID=215465 RepID=A0A9Q9EMG7_9PEZI|nr:Putative BTB/POZ domain-containing protein [Septoria linicola]
MFDSDLRVSTRTNTIDDRIVTLKVGPAPTTDFSVHEGILTEHSTFFRSALDNRWREGRSRVVEMPEDSADVATAFVEWLYFRRIASKPVFPPLLPMDDGEYAFLARLYAFGEKVQADPFCDDCLTAMVLKTDEVAEDGTRTFPSHSAITTLYNSTPGDSPARRFVVDMYVDFGMNAWIPREPDVNHPEFLADLVHAFMANRPDGPQHKQTNYHRRRKWHKRERSREFLQPAD